jgi:lactate dehydrogenase-like 2-hydroxyacid dehydrogenase
MKVLLLESAEFAPAAKKLMQKYGLVIYESNNIIFDQIEVIFVRLGREIDKKFINNYPKLKYIVSPTTGLNHIDVIYAKKKCINVISFYDDKTSIESISSTTELGIGLLISLMRKIPQAIQAVQSGKWDRSQHLGNDINKKKILVLGYGRLGKQIAAVYDVLGGKVTIYDKDVISSIKYPIVKDLINEIGSFDIVSIHLSLNDTSRNLLNKKVLSNINKNAIILNTSRGEVLDQNHLFWMVRNDKIKGVALDVISQEYSTDTIIAIQHLLKDCPEKVLVTPHIGGYTKDSLNFVEVEITKKMLSQMGYI